MPRPTEEVSVMPEPSYLSNSAIAEYAERVGAHHRIYDTEGRADVRSLVERLGGDIEFASNNETLHIFEPGRFTVYLPMHTSDRRDRFTIAHELGHYFLHYRYLELKDEEHFGRGNRNRMETEANVFASSLLMPANFFREAYERHMGESWALAKQFEVSPSAAEVRAQVLRLGPHA